MFRFFARIAIEINKILNPREETQPIQILFQNTHQDQLILLNTNINKLEKESDKKRIIIWFKGNYRRKNNKLLLLIVEKITLSI